MLVEMAKVRIIGLKSAFPETVEALYSFGKIQFEDLRPKIDSGELAIHSMEIPDGRDTEIERLGDTLQRCRSVCQGLFGDDACHVADGVDNPMLMVPTPSLLQRADAILETLEPQISELIGGRMALEEQLAELIKYEPIMRKVAPIVEKLVKGDTKNLDSVALLIEKKYAAILEKLEEVLRSTSDKRTRVVATDPDDGVIPVVVVFSTEYSKTVRAFLKEEHTNQIKLPDGFEEVPLTDALKQMEEQRIELPARIEEIDGEIKELGERNQHEISAIKDAVEDRIEEYRAAEFFGETEYTFVVEGYVPKKDFNELVAAILAVGSEVVLEEEEITPADYGDVPVEIEEKKGMLSSFRSAIGLWGTPRYGQLDPTSILALSFPFIFGMIVGDAGYGLLIVILCLVLRKRMPDSLGVQNITGVLFPAGIMTIVFGIFYFEFFGDLAHVYIPGLNQVHPIHITDSFTIPFIRTESNMMTTLLFMALGFGVIQVVIGLVLGIVNGKKSGHKKHIFEKGGILLIFFSAALIAINALMPDIIVALGPTGAAIFRYAAYVLLGVGFVFTILGGGIMGAIETLESVSHAASYIRIMAVGLVGALLADAANELMFQTMPNIAGVFIAIILHILNFAIIVFSPSIHALRLSFLEFFGKFFERGSKQYKPFTRVGKGGRS